MRLAVRFRRPVIGVTAEQPPVRRRACPVLCSPHDDVESLDQSHEQACLTAAVDNGADVARCLAEPNRRLQRGESLANDGCRSVIVGQQLIESDSQET